MQGLPKIAAALRAERGRLRDVCLEALDDHLLAELDDAEAAIDRVIDAVLFSTETGRVDSFLATVEKAGVEAKDLRAILGAVAVGVCSHLDDRAIDGRGAREVCEALKRRVASAVTLTPDEAAPSEAFVAVMTALHARDVATCSHSRATGSWARRLAAEMGLPKVQAETIESAALLHDVGKIATPDTVLLKPGPLTADEWMVMREHAAAGEKLLLQIPSLARFAGIVRSHHERIDGRGYPDGLAGHEIPFEARVIAVVDSFHAMVSARPYRAPLSPRIALETLRNGSGTQWETAVVEAMIALVERVPRARHLATGT